jgi:hypothetical protein
MLFNGNKGKCNKKVEPKRLNDRDHYECECGERWDTDKASVMTGPGQLFSKVERNPCTCP